MKLLAIETSMGRTSVALATGWQPSAISVKRLDAGQGQAERLLPLIAELMAETAIPFLSLDRIAVCIGPGGFSGIRTGVAAARGIGLAAGVTVVGATSFHIMAAALEMGDNTPETYGLVAPAGLNATFCQIVRRGCTPLTDIYVLPHSEIAEFFEDRARALAGPAAAGLLESGHISLPVVATSLAPDAETLAGIAPSLVPERDKPSPYYVRPADAKPQTRHLIPRKSD
jgi:tRNA threonylcarbamoyladenosine biosynthesis protein TsaB